MKFLITIYFLSLGLVLGFLSGQSYERIGQAADATIESFERGFASSTVELVAETITASSTIKITGAPTTTEDHLAIDSEFLILMGQGDPWFYITADEKMFLDGEFVKYLNVNDIKKILFYNYSL